MQTNQYIVFIPSVLAMGNNLGKFLKVWDKNLLSYPMKDVDCVYHMSYSLGRSTKIREVNKTQTQL